MMQHAASIDMSIEEFLEAVEKQPFELINGERRIKLPNVAGPSEVIRTLFIALYLYAVTHRLGKVFSETTFILPDTYDLQGVSGSRIPDVMVYGKERLAEYKAITENWKQRPFALVPDMVAEIISPNDRYSEIDEKVDTYLSDGVRLIWVLDPQRCKAVVYAPGRNPIYLKKDDILSGEDVLPGFEILLGKLFV
jgi:Uma2 family endonuclease